MVCCYRLTWLQSTQVTLGCMCLQEVQNQLEEVHEIDFQLAHLAPSEEGAMDVLRGIQVSHSFLSGVIAAGVSVKKLMPHQATCHCSAQGKPAPYSDGNNCPDWPRDLQGPPDSVMTCRRSWWQ